jgi:hypothetical protein
MLWLLTMRVRRRAGWWLALSYLFCVVASPLSLTFANAAAAAHCLLDEFHMTAPVHVPGNGMSHRGGTASHDHSGAMVHDHAAMMRDHSAAMHHGAQHSSDQKQSDSKGKSQPATCCGLFCVTAAPVESGVATDPSPHADALRPTLAAALGGIGPHRIDRPPIVLAPI